MVESVDIDNLGERIAAQDLANQGFKTNIDTRLPGSTDIEATGTGANLLVQVKTAVFPNKPASLSAEEERNIKSRAAKIAYQAWEAKVQLDKNHKLVGKVVWRKLA